MGLTALFWALAIALVLTTRAIARAALSRRFVVRERTLIVGAGQVGSEIARKLGRRPEYGLEVIGFLDDEPLLRPAARSRRRPAAARRHLAHRARARGLPRRARDLRVLAPAGSRADRALPALHGAGRAGRHRPAALRGDRLANAGARRRRPAARRAARTAPVALVAAAEAQPRPRALGRAAGRLRAAARLRGAADQARVAWAGALLAGADGRRRTGASGSSSSGRCTWTPRSGRPSWRT